jgi:hypothetical protein
MAAAASSRRCGPATAPGMGTTESDWWRSQARASCPGDPAGWPGCARCAVLAASAPVRIGRSWSGSRRRRGRSTREEPGAERRPTRRSRRHAHAARAAPLDRLPDDHSTCTAAPGERPEPGEVLRRRWTARRAASPSVTSSAMAPTVSSIGTSGPGSGVPQVDAVIPRQRAGQRVLAHSGLRVHHDPPPRVPGGHEAVWLPQRNRTWWPPRHHPALQRSPDEDLVVDSCPWRRT